MTLTLLKRIAVEKRVYAVPLLVALLINVLVYFIVVAPLAVKSSTAAERAQAAAAVLAAAERDRAAARDLVVGKARAEEELTTFYGKMLPSDFVAARRMTYARLPALARQSNVRADAFTFDLDQEGGDQKCRRRTPKNLPIHKDNVYRCNVTAIPFSTAVYAAWPINSPSRVYLPQ